MIGWLRSLPAPVRGSLYLAGVIAAFFLALGAGAAATVVLGPQFGQAETGEVNTLEGTALEPTGPTEKPEATEQPDESNDQAQTAKAAFIHRADQDNSSENYTYISGASIDGDPDAIVLVSPVADPYGHNIGVWYDAEARRWAIFNQDRTPMEAGAAFDVVVPEEDAGFVHRAESKDTVGNATYLFGPDTNGKPDAVVSVTQNRNPGGGEGIYNDHPVGVFYDDDVDQWAIFNQDDAPIPEGAAFNVAVSGGTDGPTN